MGSPNHEQNFPPLSSPSAPAPPTRLPSLRSWTNVVTPECLSSKDLPVVFREEPDEVLIFQRTKTDATAEEWNLSLVGFYVGRRPYYEALIAALRKTWILQCTIQLFNLSDGFFLIKFSSPVDYEMAWNGGVWFLLGRPFILQKWFPRFKPHREFYLGPYLGQAARLTALCLGFGGYFTYSQ